MDPDKAAEDLAAIEQLIASTFAPEVVQEYLETLAVASAAKQVPKPAPKKVPKARKSLAGSKAKWKPASVPDGMEVHQPNTPTPEPPSSDTEPESE